jgi:hypothetical protein
MFGRTDKRAMLDGAVAVRLWCNFRVTYIVLFLVTALGAISQNYRVMRGYVKLKTEMFSGRKAISPGGRRGLSESKKSRFSHRADDGLDRRDLWGGSF